MFKALEDAVSGAGPKRIIITMAPRHGKSTAASVIFPSWFLGRFPNKEIIVATYSLDLALDFSRKARELVDSQEYRVIFPDTVISPDAKSAQRWQTQKGGSYTAAGAGGPITGKGADCLLIDDIHKNREEAESVTMRKKVVDWYTSTAYTRLAPDGVIVVVMTRWHDGDLVGFLKKQEAEGKDKWFTIDFPAIADHDEEYRKAGEPLWPCKYSLDRLLDIKTNIGIYDWSALYQGKPLISEAQEFKQHMFKPRNVEEITRLSTRNFLTVDTAVSKAAEADFTGICINQVDSENKWNLRCWRAKVTPLEFMELLFTLFKTYRFEKVGIEKTMYLQTFKPFLDEEMRKRNVFFPVIELDHGQKAKELRIRGLLPRYEAGSIFHVFNECIDLEEELVHFPKGVHDDCADAAAYQLQLAEAPYQTPDDAGEEFGLYKGTYT